VIRGPYLLRWAGSTLAGVLRGRLTEVVGDAATPRAQGVGMGHEHPNHHHPHDEVPTGGHDPGAHAYARGGHGHGPTHGFVDPSIASTSRGLWALKWSFVGLLATALFQVVVVALSGSVALLADTIHNFADAATAIPLGIAFSLARRAATRRFTYGLGRVEDLAGIAIVATILASALVAAYQAVGRLLHPQPVEMLGAVVVASVIGFLGNEAVAVFRIRVGRQIGSAALVADGHHARVDGWTSLAVMVGALGIWAGYPLADPVVGLLITVAILWLGGQAGRTVLVRILDGVDTDTVDAVTHSARHVPDVREVTDVRARWIGHRLHSELSVSVSPELSVAEAHAVAKEVRHRLLHDVAHLGSVTVHVDPLGEGGDGHHRIAEHAHDGLLAHSHP
jgi:cation diffusion facilitator family transporter